MNFRIVFALGVAAVGLSGAAGAQTSYTVTEISTLGGPSSYALALNNDGAVVGISNTEAQPSVSRAFRWINGAIIDLGTFGGPSAEAFDINDAGQITGRAETSDSIPFNETFHAFIWQDGTMMDLGTSGGQSSRGWAINAQGEVVGASQICWFDPKNPGGPCFPVGNEYTFFWDGSEMSDLGGLLGSSDSSALGINASGHIAGQSIVVSGGGTVRHAAIWIDGQIMDLGTLGGVNSWAFDVNDAGLVLGFSDIASNLAHHPFIYNIKTNEMTDMGLPPGFLSAEALGINTAGHFVGVAFNCCEAAAFVYNGKGMHNLNELIPTGSDWTLSEATDINDAGWIVGQGTHNGAQRGFLLKPVIDSCGADINCDGSVNVVDLLAVIGAWGACAPAPAQCPADVVADGVVNINDLLAVISNWG